METTTRVGFEMAASKSYNLMGNHLFPHPTHVMITMAEVEDIGNGYTNGNRVCSDCQ